MSEIHDDLLDSLKLISKDIRKDYKSLRNRLQSILLDHRFLCNEVLPCFPDFPLIPNERCGLWYCNPQDYVQTSYFKSTDGHTNQWDFSSRRLNFHILPTIASNNGAIIVDSTRRGKKIPDALSKTIPIWCAVLNHLMLQSQENLAEKETLFVPPETVSASEYSSIKKRIPELVEKLRALDVIDGAEIDHILAGRILRPIWVYPGSSILQSNTDVFTGEVSNSKWAAETDEKFIPIILCTVSYQAQDGVDMRHGFTYVQGAADDHELWSHGLDATTFWSNIKELGNLNYSDQELEQLVLQLTMRQTGSAEGVSIDRAFPQIDGITADLSLGKVVENLQLTSQLAQELRERYSLTVILSQSVSIVQDAKEVEDSSNSVSIYRLQSGSKVSSRELKAELHKIIPSIQEHFSSKSVQEKPLLICCNTGTDMSIGVLLVALCLNYNTDWELQATNSVSKIVIRKHLAKLISHLQGRNVNPSRATLNSINSYLM